MHTLVLHRLKAHLVEELKYLFYVSDQIEVRTTYLRYPFKRILFFTTGYLRSFLKRSTVLEEFGDTAQFNVVL